MIRIRPFHMRVVLFPSVVGKHYATLRRVGVSRLESIRLALQMGRLILFREL